MVHAFESIERVSTLRPLDRISGNEVSPTDRIFGHAMRPPDRTSSGGVGSGLRTDHDRTDGPRSTPIRHGRAEHPRRVPIELSGPYGAV
jgi:hypothetical protein